MFQSIAISCYTSAEPAWLHFSENFVSIDHLLLGFL